MENINLLGKNLDELEILCEINELPKFHGLQLFRWFYNKTNLKYIKTNDLVNVEFDVVG